MLRVDEQFDVVELVAYNDQDGPVLKLLPLCSDEVTFSRDEVVGLVAQLNQWLSTYTFTEQPSAPGEGNGT